MDYLRKFWRGHRRKIFVTTGVLGSGYLLYKLYESHTRRLADLERELAIEREHDEIIKTQMQAHFEYIQRIADTTTLPHAMHYLSSRITEELDLSSLTEQLNKGKGSLTPARKLELWDELKILSFTRMVMSLWAVTMLNLYIRVQVNILGRHLYIDTARTLESSHLIDESDLIDRDDEQKFLASADFLALTGMSSLVSNMQGAVAEALKGKQLREFFNTKVLEETIMRILDVFMSTGSPHRWVGYLMPEDTSLCKQPSSPSSDSTLSYNLTKFDQLMVETRQVLASAEFASVVEISLRSVVGSLMEDIEAQSEGVLTTGMPLAKLLPRFEWTIPSLVNEPSKNRFIRIIQTVPEVELFFTLLYANMPAS